MCGINGFINFSSKDDLELKRDISLMNDCIIHRGPDSDGVFHDSNDSYAIAMGMRRLSIIDLDTGNQPIFSEDKQICIVFNGEIYNYRTLRKELESNGVHFTTKGDTEVILKLYETEGVAGFKKLDGMFGFSIYDKSIHKVFIGRDYFGEKPMYYTQQQNKFIWASELKSIISTLPTIPPINKQGLNLFFRLTYIPSPYTIYEGVYKLKPNHYLVYDLTKNEFEIEEIEKDTPATTSSVSFENAREEVKKLVEESVESRSVSDVSLGTFLSGGVDSSIVSLCLSQISSKKINTFSIGFEKKSYDETDKSRVVAKMINSDHHEFIINEKDLENNVSEILLNFDEPFSDSSSLPSYLVANKTSEHVKVALTGDGGDEVFGGYNKYYMGSINQRYTKLVPQAAHKLLLNTSESLFKTKDDKRGKRFKIKRLLNAIDYTDNYYWDIISLGYASDSLSEYLSPEYLENSVFDYYKNATGISSPKNLTEYRTIDKHMSLEGDMLVKVDRTSMLTSLECRAPFLNKKIWKYTNSLPAEYLMKGWDKKFILKEAFKDQFPDGFLDKSKAGFGVPVGDWLRSSLKKELESFIAPSFLKEQHIFKEDKITKLVKDHINGRDNTFKVWTFFCFQKWYKNIYMNH
ncbi:asparagine synthase (glutamine-hydrolyzing) [Aquimarina hainanensis]|uniref:asparagine synthase (glutamine-hydrolyzing) n=1 Tax=Aquimarina hainanensis TaxID=1578017 RepID=A0ABW5NDY6_9FLAO|nr:asparagine synthase (glutamine-hydrolyzing) [Aquimarina sp. TRL1]QKX06866.1 asparagine synthase (glutamine-hydrolyzing) [Aquimarina sp. TRL1]